MSEAVKIKITYCGMWNYYPKAVSLAQEIKETFGYETQLVKSSGGVYEIEKNGKLIFSKKNTGRFPEQGEIIKLLS